MVTIRSPCCTACKQFATLTVRSPIAINLNKIKT